MMDDPYPSFEFLCRLCLQPGAGTVSIFPTNDAIKTRLSIPVRIMACAALEVLPNDGLPKAVCAECRYQLEKSYYFRKRCQLSDNKLKKHLRLLRLGKKSRIFSRTPEEEFEDELEFEDSLTYLREKDADRKREEEERNECWKEWIKEVLKDEIINWYREQIKKSCRMELCAEVEDKVIHELRASMQDEIRRSLRKEVWQEVRAEVRDEVIQDVRESLKFEVRDECTQQAKEELRDEIKTECREEAREILLEELDDFLCYNRRKKFKNTEKEEHQKLEDLLNATLGIDEISSYQENGEKLETSSLQKAEKRPVENLLTRRAQKLKLDAQPRTNNSDNEITSTEQAISFEALPNDNQSESEAEVDVTEPDYYIMEGTDNDSIDQESVHQESIDHEENELFSFDDQVNFQITPSESSDNGNTSYQIEENVDVKFFKKEIVMQSEHHDEVVVDETDNIDKDVLIFDLDMQHEESLEQPPEFVSIDKDSLSVSKTKTKPLNESIKRTAAATEENSGSKNTPTTSIMQCSNNIAKSFRCPKCPRAFTTETSMLRHMLIHRTLEKKGVNHRCPDCDIILSCRSALKRHMVKHTGRRPYVCEECGKSFIQREILKRHMLTHSGIRPHECPHCERSFSQKLNLTQHVNKSHTENPKIQQYACHMCPKRFNHASGLSRHLATHNGVIFRCSECERTFTDRSSVKRHIAHVHGKTRGTSTNEDETKEHMEDIDGTVKIQRS